MKRATLIAAIATPLLAASIGVGIARFSAHGGGGGACAAPTVLIEMADGATIATGGPNSLTSCEGDTCYVAGPEQVEVQADGRVQCVDVNEGRALALTRRAGGVSIVEQESGR